MIWLSLTAVIQARSVRVALPAAPDKGRAVPAAGRHDLRGDQEGQGAR